MGWYLRKSFSSGPARFNLSKSGLGISLGVKGARVGIGPRGAYTHLGRGGLYYRSSFSGTVGVGSPSAIGGGAVVEHIGRSTALFEDQQVYARNLQLELDFRRTRKLDVVFGVIGLLCWVLGLGSSNNILAKGSEWLAIGVVVYLFYREISFHILKARARKVGSELIAELKRIREQRVDLDSLKSLIAKARLKGKLLQFALSLFYQDFISDLLFDAKITDTEHEELRRTEGLLGLDDSSMKTIKKWGFNKAYLQVIQDKQLSADEDRNIAQAQNILGLSDGDIQEELDTLNILRKVRKVQEEGLTAVEISVQLEKDETCYHRTGGRIVKEKTIRSYQSAGVRHKVTDMVVEKTGELFLTSKRILIIGEGVQSIKLEKIFDVETDLDNNTIALTVDNRKTPVVLSVPDSYLFSVKLNKLLARPS